MRSGQNSARLSPDNDILAVLGVVDVRSLSRKGLSTPDLLTSRQVQGGQGWNAHGVGLSSPQLRTSATFVDRISAQRISLDGSLLPRGPQSRSARFSCLPL